MVPVDYVSNGIIVSTVIGAEKGKPGLQVYNLTSSGSTNFKVDDFFEVAAKDYAAFSTTPKPVGPIGWRRFENEKMLEAIRYVDHYLPLRAMKFMAKLPIVGNE